MTNKNKLLLVISRGCDIASVISVLSTFLGVSISITIPASVIFVILGIVVSGFIEIAPHGIEGLKQYIERHYSSNDSESLHVLRSEIDSIISKSSRTTTVPIY